jgi:hypothetical protein
MPKKPSFTSKLASLGEELQDSGNGTIAVTTHAGLWVRITFREKHPTPAAIARLFEIGRKKTKMLSTTRLSREDRSLERRRLVRFTKRDAGRGTFVVITKAGLIALLRFSRMKKVIKKRIAAAHDRASKPTAPSR